ncbi:MAG: hypothetical protein M1540_02395 [Candidatus Bathyarchaeota archaeon]|nr:hypothetical protein [Candidatus Bathyarchaeota archaeon]
MVVTYNETVIVNDNTLEVREHWENPSYDNFLYALYNHTFLDRAGKLQFYDLNTGNYVILRGELTGGYPALVCSQHLAIEKDLIAKGFLNSLEGEVALNAGSYSPGWGPYTSNPFIWLKDTSYPTLEIRKVVAAGQGDADKLNPINYIWGWGNLALGDLTVHGSLHWSSGAYLTDNQGGSIELGNSSAAVSYPFIDFHFGRSTTEDFNVRLINYQDCILEFHARTSTGGILPASSGIYVLGSPDKHWSYVYADYLRYDVNISIFDAYDDLALVKLWGEKDSVIPDIYDQTKLKPPTNDPFSILKGTDKDGKVENEFFDVGKTVSFAMGCAKALAKKQDEHDALLLNLLGQIESLRTEIAIMKNA